MDWLPLIGALVYFGSMLLFSTVLVLISKAVSSAPFFDNYDQISVENKEEVKKAR